MVDVFQAAVPPRSRGRAVLLSLLALLVVVVGALMGQLLLAPLVASTLLGLPSTAVGAALERLAYLLLAFGPVYLLLMIIVRLREKRGFGYLFGWPETKALSTLCAGLFIGLALSAAPIALGIFTGQAVVRASGGVPGIEMAIALCWAGLFIQSMAEELVFRAWLLPALQAPLGMLGALVLSSLVFAAAHSLNPNIVPVQVLSLFLAGLALGVLTLAAKSIWPAAVAHSLWNWVQYQGVALDGQQPNVGALFLAVHSSGKSAFNGQELEATFEFVVCVFTLLVLVTFIFWGKFRSGQTLRAD
jgi:uncharacterized protein